MIAIPFERFCACSFGSLNVRYDGAAVIVPAVRILQQFQMLKDSRFGKIPCQDQGYLLITIQTTLQISRILCGAKPGNVLSVTVSSRSFLLSVHSRTTRLLNGQRNLLRELEAVEEQTQ